MHSLGFGIDLDLGRQFQLGAGDRGRCPDIECQFHREFLARVHPRNDLISEPLRTQLQHAGVHDPPRVRLPTVLGGLPPAAFLYEPALDEAGAAGPTAWHHAQHGLQNTQHKNSEIKTVTANS